MTPNQIVAGITIHLLVPLMGVATFGWLCRRMIRTAIHQPPFVPLFCLFGILGGWLLILLTSLFWEWSGMASLGFLALAFGAPWLTLGLSLQLRTRRKNSAFHRWAFWLSASYSFLMLILVVVWLGICSLAGEGSR